MEVLADFVVSAVVLVVDALGFAHFGLATDVFGYEIVVLIEFIVLSIENL